MVKSPREGDAPRRRRRRPGSAGRWRGLSFNTPNAHPPLYTCLPVGRRPPLLSSPLPLTLPWQINRWWRGSTSQRNTFVQVSTAAVGLKKNKDLNQRRWLLRPHIFMNFVHVNSDSLYSYNATQTLIMIALKKHVAVKICATNSMVWKPNRPSMSQVHILLE